MKNMLLFMFTALLGCSCNSFAEPEVIHPVVKWRFKTDGAIRADAVVDGDRLFVASLDGQLHALRKADGKHLWTVQTHGALAGEPAVSDETVVVVSRDNRVYALDRASGQEKWRFRMQPEEEAGKSGWKYFSAAPVVANKTVYVGSADSHLYALDLATGHVIWKFATRGQIRATPLVDGNTIYQPSNDGIVYVLNAADGSLLWQFETDGTGYDPDDFGFDRRSIYTKPLLAKGLLIVGSRDGNVYAIDIVSRTAKWKFAYDTTWAMSIAVDEDTVYAGWSTNDRFNALDLETGQEKWQFTSGAHNYTTPLVSGKSVYFGSADGKFYRLDKVTGEKIWEYAVGPEIYSSPIYDKNTKSIFIGSDDGYLYSISEGTPVHKAVYQPSVVEGPSQYLVVDAKITPYLTDRGFEGLDSPERLLQFVQDRLKDNAPSVIVFAFPVIPESIMGQPPGAGLMRRYLESGGKVVWFGDPPNFYAPDETGNFSRSAGPAAKLLEVSYSNLSESGNYQSRATQEGLNWGLHEWFKTTATPVSAEDVIPLAHDEFGRVSAWVKYFNPRAGSGFVSLRTWSWNVPVREDDLGMIYRVAVYGLE